MADYVTVFGAARSGDLFEQETNDRERLVVYAPGKAEAARGYPRRAEQIEADLQARGGLLIQERIEGTGALVRSSMFPSPEYRPPKHALWLGIRDSDRMTPVEPNRDLKLGVGDHLLFPADEQAEAVLDKFYRFVQQFPEETRRLVLASIRRPSLDWEVSRIQEMLNLGVAGREGAASTSLAGRVSAAGKGHRFTMGLAAGVLICAALGAAGLFATRRFGLPSFLAPPGTAAALDVSSMTSALAVMVESMKSAKPKASDADFDASMKELHAALSATKDKDLEPLRKLYPVETWRSNPDIAWVLAILFHRAAGSKIDPTVYKAPLGSSPALAALLRKSIPEQRDLLLYGGCLAQAKALPSPLKLEDCKTATVDVALKELRWIVDFMKRHNAVEAP